LRLKLIFISGNSEPMVVCLCQGVSDKSVRASIEAGARTRQQVTDACGAGDGCGGCHRSIKTLIVECRPSAPGTACPSTSRVFAEAAAPATI
jgi:bacterioferritin-associated ferredoxin